MIEYVRQINGAAFQKAESLVGCSLAEVLQDSLGMASNPAAASTEPMRASSLGYNWIEAVTVVNALASDSFVWCP
jgi:hypothetical protein